MTKTIKEWREEERPREKMLSRGCASLTDSEILSILIRSGNSDGSAVDLAGRILDLCEGRLTTLSRISPDRLCSIRGIGPAKALSVLAAAELGRRIASEGLGDDTAVDGSLMVAKMMAPLLKGLQHEECWVLFLNRSSRILGKEKISSGGLSATVMDIKMIVRRAVEKLASGIIVVHNHPSGNPRPGKEDLRQTAALREAAACLDIELIDHIIVSGNKYFSFSDENVIFAKI